MSTRGSGDAFLRRTIDSAEDGGTDPVSAAALANAVSGEGQAVIEPIRDFPHNPA
ncbi:MULTISPECIES: hypothetical protein [Amycolatopsis]|uniref:Uncharacterized protein n=1 Tax=Amycolatopsis dendrobii TaxID=2760662 RepID=A0A7W3W3T0_9PSEU|nr:MULTISPECIES: hypothetical protein [Amycolatopsis]MBB1158209.1 hypothetical protein [Amycolatopsis dendrobii]UKD56713.1 hypothetical protein L3Q65_08330 [Amycolatopsis sp. FU40]